MAVYTQVQVSDLSPIVQRFGLGSVVRLQGIGSGIENTNYFLDTQNPNEAPLSYVLTIFENLEVSSLPYFNAFTSHLARNGLAVPAPVVDRNNESLFVIANKNAIIVPCLKGAALTNPELSHCAAVGEWLAQMHLGQNEFTKTRPLVRDLEWMKSHQAELNVSKIPDADRSLLASLIARYESYRVMLQQCPQGTVHGDLFRDNVLFENGRISGVIDFYHACSAPLLFDVAVCVNDWATDGEGNYKTEHVEAILSAYKKVRAWARLEIEAWPKFLEVAALRFWISRLTSKYVAGYQHESLEGEPIKDPDGMRHILESLLRTN